MARGILPKEMQFSGRSIRGVAGHVYKRSLAFGCWWEQKIRWRSLQSDCMQKNLERWPQEPLQAKELDVLVVVAEVSGQCEPSEQFALAHIWNLVQPKPGQREPSKRFAAAHVWYLFQPMS